MNRRSFLRSLAGLACVPVLGKVVKAAELPVPIKAALESKGSGIDEAAEFAKACREMLDAIKPAIEAMKGFGEVSSDTAIACSRWIEMDTMKAFGLTPSEWEKLATEDRGEMIALRLITESEDSFFQGMDFTEWSGQCGAVEYLAKPGQIWESWMVEDVDKDGIIRCLKPNHLT